MSNEAAANPGKPRRERSARYPGVGLAETINLCRFIDERGLDGLTAADIASALGYSNIKTNTFSARLSAARQFGLIDLKDEGYHLTRLAKSILHPQDRSDVGHLLRQALATPPIFAELIQRLDQKRVPDAAILANVLYHNYEIIASAKEAAAESFLDSARFAGVIGPDQILRREAAPPSVTAVADASPPEVNAGAVKARSQANGGERGRQERTAAASTNGVRIDLKLWGRDQGKIVRVRAPESMTNDSFERLIQTLRLHVQLVSDTPNS